MKIIQVNASYKPAYIYGGPTMSVSKLSEELVKAGLDLSVFTTKANGATELDIPDETQRVDGVPVHYFKRLTKDHTHFSPALLWALRKEIMESRKQKGESGEATFQHSNIPTFQQSNHLIIHIHAWWNLVSIFAALVAWLHGVKVVLSPRGMLTTYTLGNRNATFKSLIHFFIGKRLLRYSHIHATSKKEQDDILQRFKVESVTVIPNFVRLADGDLIEKTANQTYQLLFLSRIEEKKGLELLFEALSKLDFDWQLQIAGDGEENYITSLKQKAESLKLNHKIQWLGQVNNEEKFKLMASNDVLVLTSYNENFANVVIESLSVGTAVLVSDQVGLADYVTTNDLGWVTSLNPDSIAKTIQSSHQATEKRAKIRSTSPSIIKKDFAEQYIVKQYIDMYQHLTV